MKRPQPLNRPDRLRPVCISLVKNLEKRSPRRLKKISDKLMRELAIHYSLKRFSVTLLAYVLYKIVSKPRLISSEHDKEMANIERSINELTNCIDSCNDEVFNKTFEKVKDYIKNLDKTDPRFLLNRINKGKLKIGAIVYAQGFSLGRASELTGIDRHDIQNYSGKTYMIDRIKEEKTIFERLDMARRIISRKKE